jgi:hypothetical protein
MVADSIAIKAASMTRTNSRKLRAPAASTGISTWTMSAQLAPWRVSPRMNRRRQVSSATLSGSSRRKRCDSVSINAIAAVTRMSHRSAF